MSDIVNQILQLKPSKQIREYICGTYNLTARSAERLIAAARKEIINSYKEDIKSLSAALLNRLNELYGQIDASAAGGQITERERISEKRKLIQTCLQLLPNHNKDNTPVQVNIFQRLETPGDIVEKYRITENGREQ